MPRQTVDELIGIAEQTVRGLFLRHGGRFTPCVFLHTGKKMVDHLPIKFSSCRREWLMKLCCFFMIRKAIVSHQFGGAVLIAPMKIGVPHLKAVTIVAYDAYGFVKRRLLLVREHEGHLDFSRPIPLVWRVQAWLDMAFYNERLN